MSDLEPAYMGRCDICGSPIDLTAGEDLTVLPTPELPDGFAEEEFWEQVASALETLDPPEAHTLATTLREEHGAKVHADCLDDAGYSDIMLSEERVQELTGGDP